MGRTVRISNRTEPIRFGSKFELGMKKIRTELSCIFYCSKIELENICRIRLTGHDTVMCKNCTRMYMIKNIEFKFEFELK